jgi:hypothetical protein
MNAELKNQPRKRRTPNEGNRVNAELRTGNRVNAELRTGNRVNAELRTRNRPLSPFPFLPFSFSPLRFRNVMASPTTISTTFTSLNLGWRSKADRVESEKVLLATVPLNRAAT